MYCTIESFTTTAKETRDVTALVRQAVKASGVQSGVCHLAQVAATAGLWVCHKDPLAQQEVMDALERMTPERADFAHRETAADASGHIKTLISDNQLTLIVQDGQLLLGQDQAVVYAEYDGPRPRSLSIAVMADK